MAERTWAWRVVREPLAASNPDPVLRYRYVRTDRDGVRRLEFVGSGYWGDTVPDLARHLGDLAEALTRPVLTELDGRLEEETP